MYKKLILKYQRFIDQAGILIPCYYYNYFKSPGLKTYPEETRVNSDYNLIKVQVVANSDIFRIASNFYYVGSKFQLFLQVDYIIMMPLKPNSFSNMGQIITNLVTIIHKNNQESKIEFINDLFLVKPYRQF